MQDKFSDIEIEILIEYVESAEAFIAIGGAPECECDEWSTCSRCADMARAAGLILKAHGYPCQYSDGALSIEARMCAERLYANYCVKVGRVPIGITM